MKKWASEERESRMGMINEVARPVLLERPAITFCLSQHPSVERPYAILCDIY